MLSSLSIGALDGAGVIGSSLRHVMLGIGPTDGPGVVEGGVHKIERGVSTLAIGRFLSDALEPILSLCP